MSRCASRKDVRKVRRWRSSTRKPRRVRKKGGLARSFGLRRGQEDQRSQAAHPGRHVGSPVERCSSSRRRSRPRWSIPSVAPGTPTVPLHQAHLCRRWLCGREDGARRVAHRDMEAGDCEATRCHRFRDLVQKMDRRKDIRLDQPQSSPSPRFRTLRHNSCRVRPLGHDPHHAKARKLLVMNPNLPDGLLERSQLWNIVEQVRNLILNWSLKLEKAGVLGEDMHFSEQEKGDAKPVTQQFFIQNVGVLGSVTDQASVTNQQTAKTKIELDWGQVRDFLAQACAALPQLPEKAQEAIRPVLETIDGELKTETPSSPKIRAALGSLRKIGEGIAGNLTAQGIIAMVKAIVGA